MQAVVVEQWGEARDLRTRDWPDPEPGPGQVLVEVRAAGCNFADTLMAQGRYQERPELPFVLGTDVAGRVASCGPGVTRWRPGDRVYGACGTGAFAQHAAVDAAALRAIPGTLDDDVAICLPTTYATAYAALVYRAGLRAGETLLVHAAAGGVGSAAVQVGCALGARVIGTASADKLAIATQAGAARVIDYRGEDWVQRVLEETAGRGADVIYDPVGGEILDASLRCIAWGGRLLVIGFASGDIPEIRANRILLKNISVVGLHWPPYRTHEPESYAGCLQALEELCVTGALEPRISARYPLASASEALTALGARGTWGKLVLVP